MNITFRQLRLFLALAETGSVSGAARALHVTQPTATMQLREVTQAVGLPLYEVVSRRVRLTDAGWELARTARAMMGEWESFEQRMAATKGLEQGRLRVAMVTTAKYVVPRLLGRFCQRHPGVDVSLEVLNRDGVVARLRERLDDLYVMSRPPLDVELDDRIFMPNPLLVIAPAGHALARAGRVPLQGLREQAFILRETGSGTRMAADEHFRRQRFAPRVRLELGSNEAIREAVAGGLGLAVISLHALGTPAEPAAPRAARSDGLAVLDVEGFPIASAWHVVHPKGRRLSPAAQAFRDELIRLAPAGPAPGP